MLIEGTTAEPTFIATGGGVDNRAHTWPIGQISRRNVVDSSGGAHRRRAGVKGVAHDANLGTHPRASQLVTEFIDRHALDGLTVHDTLRTRVDNVAQLP